MLTHFLKKPEETEPPALSRQEDRGWHAALLALLAFYLAAFAIINFRGLTEYMNNDIYADTLVAKYMWDKKSLFPDGWVFGNQYYVAATPVLSALFYGLTGSVNLAMALATTGMTAAILASLYWLLRPFCGRTGALAGMTALVSSVLAMNLDSREEAQLLFVLASYYSCYLLSLLITWGDYVRCIFLKERNSCFPFFLGLLLSFANGMQSLRQTCIMVAPLLALEGLRVLSALLRRRKPDWRLTVRVAAVTAANLCGVLCIRLFHVPAVHIYGEMSPVHLGDLPDRLLQLIKAGTKITGLWYVEYYASRNGTLAFFILIFSILSIAAVLAACRRTAMRLYCGNTGGLELLICLCVLSIAAACASMLLFQMEIRSVYLFMWYLLVCLSVVSMLRVDNQRGKRLALILLCAISAANLYFSYKDSLVCSLAPNFKNNPPYYTDIADELVSRDFKILYGPATITCDICGLTDGKVLSSPWWRTPFKALTYIAPQDLRDSEDNAQAAYLLTDAQLEEALYLAEKKGAQLTLIRQFDTMGLYTSSIQLMH